MYLQLVVTFEGTDVDGMQVRVPGVVIPIAHPLRLGATVSITGEVIRVSHSAKPVIREHALRITAAEVTSYGDDGE